MNRRLLLSWLVYSMLALLVVAFAWVLFSGTRTELEDEAPDNAVLFADLAVGESRLQRIDGELVWVTHISPQQMQQASSINEWLKQPLDGCATDLQYCVLSAVTQRSGVYVRFTAQAPSQLNADASWLGGFVDPSSNEVFDLWGRAYRQNNPKRSSLLQINY